MNKSCHTVVGKLDVVKLYNGNFLVHKNRKIRIWTPIDYDKDAKKPYDVIFMFDGQNLFDDATSFVGEWHIDEAIEGIEEEDHIRPSIVVGIDASADRLSEYLPSFSRIAIGNLGYKGDDTLKYLIESVIPYVEENYNVGKTRLFRSLGGSSMGGLMTLAGAISYPDIFSKLYAFSIAFPIFKYGLKEESPVSKGIGNDAALSFVIKCFCNQKMLNKFKIAICSGGQGIEEAYYPYVRMIKNRLISTGWKEKNIATFQNRDFEHNEFQWSTFFPEAYRFMKR